MVDHVVPGTIYRIVGGNLFRPVEEVGPGKWKDENGKMEHVSFFAREAKEDEIQEFEMMAQGS